MNELLNKYAECCVSSLKIRKIIDVKGPTPKCQVYTVTFDDGNKEKIWNYNLEIEKLREDIYSNGATKEKLNDLIGLCYLRGKQDWSG